MALFSCVLQLLGILTVSTGFREPSFAPPETRWPDRFVSQELWNVSFVKKEGTESLFYQVQMS